MEAENLKSSEPKKPTFASEFKKVQKEYDYVKDVRDPAKLKNLRRQVFTALLPLKENAKKADLAKILRWEKKIRVISKPDDFKLNELEWEAIKPNGDDMGEARCVDKLPSSGYQCHVGDTVKFKKQYDEEVEKERYTFYVVVIKDPQDEIPKSIGRKLEMGFQVAFEEYPEEKMQVWRHVLYEKEFDKYFVIED